MALVVGQVPLERHTHQRTQAGACVRAVHADATDHRLAERDGGFVAEAFSTSAADHRVRPVDQFKVCCSAGPSFALNLQSKLQWVVT